MFLRDFLLQVRSHLLLAGTSHQGLSCTVSLPFQTRVESGTYRIIYLTGCEKSGGVVASSDSLLLRVALWLTHVFTGSHLKYELCVVDGDSDSVSGWECTFVWNQSF